MGMVNATLRPLYPRERDAQCQFYTRLGGHQGQSVLEWNISPPPAFDHRPTNLQ